LTGNFRSLSLRFTFRLHVLKDAMKIDHFNANFWFGDLPQDKVLGSMELFRKDVMPAFS